MSKDKYYLGLDVGTNSIGWAVTDEKYNIIRAKGQDLWGVRKFDEAENAGDTRRGKRSTRRNLSRRRQRISYLNEIFKEEINKIDPLFLTRLKESQLYLEDKSTEQKYTLFNDAGFTDKDFHGKYKTINHLIVDLIENGTDDVRLLYLAIHKLLKNRGHFLFENLKIDSSEDLSKSEGQLLLDLNESISSVFNDDVVFDFTNIEAEFLDILKEKATKTDKKRRLKEFLNLTGKDDISKQKFEIVSAMIGSSTKLSVIFNDEEIANQIKENDLIKDKFDVDIEEFDEYLDSILDVVGLEGVELLSSIKKIYDWTLLSGILGGHKLVSYGMKQIYDDHGKDLKYLKNYIKKHHSRQVYVEMFKEKSDKIANYANYVAHLKSGNKKVRTKKKEQKDFYSYVNKIIKDDENEEVAYIKEKIALGTFMPKQVSKVNASIPNQLRMLELDLILKKNAPNFKFLSEKDESDVTNAKKLLDICSFRIPYYVGPLNDAHPIDKGGFAWVKKKEGFEREKITPWNFDEIVDKQKSNEAFLQNLINDCSHLMGEKVLPKHSLLNARYVILNTINKIKINFNLIDDKIKKELFNHLILYKKITRKTIENYFVTNGIIEKQNVKTIEGIDVDLNLNFPAYATFKQILGDKVSYENDFYLMEEIILWATQSADSKMLESKLREKYANRFSSDDIIKLSKLKFADWGRLSEKFLTELKGISKQTGAVYSIIEALWETNYNLNQLLSGEYTFKDQLRNYNDTYVRENNINETIWDRINKSYAPNKVKRQIWQTMLVANEIKDVLGSQPSKIFIEMARGGGEKGKRTVSRKRALLDIYKKSFAKEERDWLSEINGRSDSDFRSERLYLYYTQKGLCAYSGEPISLSDLFKVNLYDIDHIYPQAKIKDDSIIKNKVLVKKDKNAEKGDTYPIRASVREKMTPIWESWNRVGLIDDEKLKRLKRHVPLTLQECQEFINRQLVETRQTTKIAAKFLEELFDKGKVVYSKSGNVNQFKQLHRRSIKRDDGTWVSDIDHFVKVREINDLHHAKDAYLNIVVGNVYNTKFGYNAADYFSLNSVDSYNLNNLFKWNLKNAWVVDGEDKSIEIVKRNYNKNTAIVSNMVYQKTGKFYDETLQPASDKKNLIPLKTSEKFLDGKLSDTSKYGSYTGIQNAYACVIRFTKNKKVNTRFEFVPIIIDVQTKQGTNSLENYFNQLHSVNDVKVLFNKIKIKSLFKVNGSFVNFTGTTSGQIKWINASQLILDKFELNYIKKLYNYERRQAQNRNEFIEIIERHDGINKDHNLELYDILINKLQSKVYKNLPGANYEDVLIEKRQDFEVLSIENQTLLLLEILKLLQPNAITSDLTLINKSKNSGIITSGQNIDGYEEFKLIQQSPTGLFRKIIDFKKL